MIRQSGARLAGRRQERRAGARCVRSELVTVPSFSPQAERRQQHVRERVGVGVAPCTSETTTSSQRCERARTWSASGRLTTGLVAMIHTALIAAVVDRLEQLDRLQARLASAIAGLSQNCLHRVRDAPASSQLHVRGQHVGEAAHFAPAHRVGLAGERERPHARLADAAGRAGGS